MSNRRNDEYGEILQVISEETKYFKQYEGKVLDTGDELNKGRVKISVPELGWFLPTESPWVDAEYFGRGCIVPKVDDWVVVYFIAGNVNRPRYRSRTSALTGSTPGSYTGPETVILYEDDTVVIMYDGEVVTVNAGSKKVRVKNDNQNLATLIGELMDDILALQTAGSPAAHVLAPASTSQFNALKTKFDSLLEV
jgi:hypothetical protein